MRESSVGAFARSAMWIACAAAALVTGAGPLLAQAGKLEGRIRDQAGAPIASAQVRIEGTAFGAVADSRGYYFINNIPAGSIDVTAQFVGYKPVRVTGVRIPAGQTVTQDFALEQQAVDIGEIEVTAAVNALVPRDAVTTKQTITGEYAEKLPVDRIQNVIALQPGVVISRNGGINIRGGRNDEAVTYIDGVPVTPGGRGGNFVGVATGDAADVSIASFEDASVTTGGSSAEFGNAQSGVIAIQTRGGGARWSGNLTVENDEIGGKNHSRGFNAIGGGVGGPIAGGLTFYLSGDIQGAKSDAAGFDRQNNPIFLPAGVDTTVAVIDGTDTTQVDVSRFAVFTGTCDEFKSSVDRGIRDNYGFSCQGARIPFTANSSYRGQAKLQYTFGAGNRVAASFLRSDFQDRDLTYANVTNPQGLFANWSQNNVAILNWTQNLSKSADRALALDLYASYQWDRAITGPLARQSEQDTRDPFGGFMVKRFDFLYDFKSFPISDIDANFRINRGRRSPYDLDNTTQYSLIDEYRNNPYGLTGFNEGGGPTGRIGLYKEDRAVGRGNIDWQLDRYNRVKLGGEYTKYYINSFSSQLTSQAFSDAYHEKPTRWNGFIEDRLDLGDVVLVGGLRYDWYKSGASRSYFFADTLGNLSWFPRLSTAPGFDPASPASAAAGCQRGGPVAAACVNQYAGLVADKSHNYLSPHIQVSFPVTERTNFRLSYAHQVQAPDFNLILGGINTDLKVTNTNHVYGSDLDFGRTVTFEFGIRHSFNDDMVLDISAYNKDKLSDGAARLVKFFDPATRFVQDIRVVTNADFGNARGVDVRFDRRIGELFNGSLAYTFEDAKNTGSDPFTYINVGSRILNAVSGGNQPPPQAAQVTNQSRPHNFAGQLALSFPNNWKSGTTAGKVLQNVGVFAIFRFASGLAFTRCPVDIPEDDNVFAGGAGTTGTCSRRFEGDYNGARLPMFKQFDLRLTKGFGVGGLDFTAYSEVRNIFNFKNINTVFAQTNDIVNPQERSKVNRGDLDEFANEATANGVFGADNSIDLRFAGAGRSGCANWTNAAGTSATPNCVYMIRAEQRYGDGNGIFTLAEQTRASDALYFWNRGVSNFTGSPRSVRLGLEVNF
jgi:Carboxypeptidase regulatory-like domain/TonB-dependent Receptor Plug Domain